jgi:alcohol dehydrogenase class IV
MRFEFATATRIIFGEGTAATLPELARSFGARPLVVTGAAAERAAWLVAALKANHAAETFSVPGEPTVELVRAGARRAQDRTAVERQIRGQFRRQRGVRGQVLRGRENGQRPK